MGPHYHSRTMRALLAILLTATLPACATTSRYVAPESLQISLEMLPGDRPSTSEKKLRYWYGEHPIVIIRIVNAGHIPVAFSDTFGFGVPWLNLRVENLDGIEAYPGIEADLFSHMPKYTCLEPGEELSIKVNLWSWHLRVSGQDQARAYSYNLPAGSYRIRARYEDGPPIPTRARCAAIEGTVSSEWLYFEVDP